MTSRTTIHSQPRQGGFTLVEVTLALGILSAMVLINYQMLMTLVESKAEIDDKRDAIFVANSVLTRLTRELQLAVKNPLLLPPCEDPTGSRRSSALLSEGGGDNSAGDDPSIIFTASEGGQYIPDGGTHSGAVQITYRVEQDPEAKDSKNAGLLLVRDEIPNRQPFDVACKDTIRFPITNRLVKMEYKFFDKKNGEWTTTWAGPQANSLPDIIQFTIWLRSDKGRVTSYTSAVKLAP